MPNNSKFSERMLDNWHRIERIVRWTGLSVNAFAREIGLNRAENLYQIKKGNNGISRDLAETITAKYPSINKAWLLMGVGDMLGNEARSSSTDIPVYETEISKLIANRDNISPSYYISMPMFSGSDFAALFMSDAMMPEIPAGAVVMFKQASIETITPGKMYYVQTDTLNGIRYIRRELGREQLRLVPANRDKYDDIVVDPSKIDTLYLIRGVIIDKTI